MYIMETGKHFNFEEKYKELIQYISQLGGGILPITIFYP